MSNLGYNTKILPKAQIACFAYRIDVFISYCINILSISCRTANRQIFEHGTAHEEATKNNTRIARVASGGEKWLCNIYLLLATVAWFFSFSPAKSEIEGVKMKNSMSEWKVNSTEAIWSFLLLMWLLIEVKNLVSLATACTHENLNWGKLLEALEQAKSRDESHANIIISTGWECCWQIPTRVAAIIISQSQRITFLIKNAWQELTSKISTARKSRGRANSSKSQGINILIPFLFLSPWIFHYYFKEEIF